MHGYDLWTATTGVERIQETVLRYVVVLVADGAVVHTRKGLYGLKSQKWIGTNPQPKQSR